MQDSSTISAASPHDVATTVERLVQAAGRRGVTVFATIDHAAGARAAGLALADETLLVLGSAKVGTLLMQEAPSVGLELPLRILTRATDTGTTIAYADPQALAERFGIVEHRAVLDGMRELLAQLVNEATRT